ncbi:uracil-DNA glycosylase [Virgibacillus kekensis]|uniref:Uracil-DNA glycosylase n=1 Tax=Virgibacillus kekensis TaxID=202261 RepID=A0ABV9DI49_9BACI
MDRTTDWNDILTDEFDRPYFQKLQSFLDDAYKNKNVYPERKNLFRALELTPFYRTKVVILGQDPYHGEDQAHGLSFSVKKGMKKPPSLKNIFKELESDLGIEEPEHGCLEGWAEQGVLLLNTVLTVEEGRAGSHQNIGWEEFTNTVIRTLNEKRDPVVFILWGKKAQAKKDLIEEKHYIIKSPHPSPFSARRGFFGSLPFSKVNTILEKHNLSPIDWRL